MDCNKTVQKLRRVLCFIMAFIFMFTFLCGCVDDEKEDSQNSSASGENTSSEAAKTDESKDETSASEAGETKGDLCALSFSAGRSHEAWLPHHER